MERLTEWYDDGQQKGILVKEYPTENSMKTLYQKFGERDDYFDCEEGYLGMEKLKAYEDAEEQGFLQRIECHCKDCIHWSDRVAGATEHVKLCTIGNYMVGKNGYCVYAEQALKQMGE